MTDFDKALKRMNKGFERFVKAHKRELQRQRERQEQVHRKLMEIINDPDNQELLGGVQ